MEKEPINQESMEKEWFEQAQQRWKETDLSARQKREFIKQEQERLVNLKINEPVGGTHTWEIEFTCSDGDLCRLYNKTIKEVCDTEKLGPFLQTQSEEEGYYAWEMLGGKTSKEHLAILLSKIHVIVEKLRIEQEKDLNSSK